MTTTDTLDIMTVKDLRQLASEHRIPGRSALGKQDLIKALTAILEQRCDNAEAAKPAPAPAPEPEVLDPAAVASLMAGGGGNTQTADDPQASGDTQDADDTQGQSDEGEPRKKRRRRRRRRKKSGTGEDGGSAAGAEDGPAGDTAAAVPDQPADKTAVAIPDQPAKDRQPAQAAARPVTEPVSAADAQAPEAPATPAETASSSPAEPRLDKDAVTGLGPMHQRLVALARGLVELCDPDTPAWAQARLGELLDAAGVRATPCAGEPHPDYHVVVGHEPDSDLPSGHIAVVEAPGFCLGGDRNGRMFSLRCARVRVAGHSQDRSRSGKGADASATVARSASVDTEHGKSSSPSPQDAPTAQEAVSQAVQETPADAPQAAQEEQPQAQQKGRSRSRRGGSSRGKEPARNDEDAVVAVADQSTSATSVTSETDPEVVPTTDVDAVGGSDRRRGGRRSPQGDREDEARRHQTPVQRQDLAEPLPLPMQDADELAARPKAEAFRALGLNDQLLADCYDMQFQEPSPIQTAAIPVAVAGRDLIGQAQTGTGKTAAFVLPILQRLYEIEQTGIAALVLCPTRELARQVHEHFVRMAGQSAARAALIYGGVSMHDQLTALDCKPHVVIGTPGRLIDHIRRHTLDCSQLAIAVLDEADQMLDIGFLPDIEYILSHTNPQRQTLLFSATMPDEIKRLCARYQHDPEHIHMIPERVTTDHVNQAYIAVDHNKKTDLLAHFIDTQEVDKLVVFCKTKAQTDRVASVLKRKKYKAAAIHGDLPQSKREKTLQQFREGSLTCLIATNVAARGLDIPTVSHVINYDIPEYAEDYVHRIGRTGRMGGCDGFARTFITPEDGQFLLEIEKLIGMELEEEEVPGITASTATAVKRTIGDMQIRGPRLVKPLVGGIRLGRRRR